VMRSVLVLRRQGSSAKLSKSSYNVFIYIYYTHYDTIIYNYVVIIAIFFANVKTMIILHYCNNSEKMITALMALQLFHLFLSAYIIAIIAIIILFYLICIIATMFSEPIICNMRIITLLFKLLFCLTIITIMAFQFMMCIIVFSTHCLHYDKNNIYYN
jgi:hypothetical protein